MKLKLGSKAVVYIESEGRHKATERRIVLCEAQVSLKKEKNTQLKKKESFQQSPNPAKKKDFLTKTALFAGFSQTALRSGSCRPCEQRAFREFRRKKQKKTFGVLRFFSNFFFT